MVGILVGNFGTVPFGRNPDCLAGIGKLLAPALGGWYFWYCTFWREPSFDKLAGTLFLKNLAGTPLRVSHRLRRYKRRTYVYPSIYLSIYLSIFAPVLMNWFELHY